MDAVTPGENAPAPGTVVHASSDASSPAAVPAYPAPPVPVPGPRATVTSAEGVLVGSGVQNNAWHWHAPPPVPPPDHIVVGSIPLRPPAFQLREDLMAQLRAAGSGVSVIHAVTGMRGVGKTQLAAAYARERISEGWRLVAWVNAETMSETLNSLAMVADRLSLARPSADLEATAVMVRNHLEADGHHCLLVFDNVTDLTSLTRYIPSGGCQVIITSTVKDASFLGRPLPVDVYTPRESLTFLMERVGSLAEPATGSDASDGSPDPGTLADPAAPAAKLGMPYAPARPGISPGGSPTLGAADDAETPGRGPGTQPEASRNSPASGDADSLRMPDDAVVLAEELGHLPLALAQAAAVIQGQGLTYAVYLSRFRSLPLREYLTPRAGEPYPQGVAEAIILSLDAVTSDDESGRCAALLDLIALLFPSGASRYWLYRADPECPDYAVDAALDRLVGASLLFFASDGNTVTAHRLVTRLVRERQSHNGTLPAVAARACALLEREQGSLGEPWQNRPAVRDWVQHVLALSAGLAHDLRGQETDLMRRLLKLRWWALRYLLDLGDTAGKAVELGESIAADHERMLGGSHPDTLTSRNNLAHAYQAAGRQDDAISLFEATVAESERVFGPSHPDTLMTRNNLASAYEAAGRLGDAILLCETTLAESERLLGASHPNTLTSRNNLASAYQDVGRLSEAITLLEAVRAERERALGGAHPDTLTSWNNLASVYQDVGRLSEAITLLEAVRAGRERILGSSHPDTLTSWNNLAFAYEAAGRLDEATPLYEATLTEREGVLGNSHPDTLMSRNNLASAYEAAERREEAIPLYEAALAGRERVLGSQHPDTLMSRNNLASAYAAAGRLEEAIDLLESALAGLDRILGTEHPDTLLVRENLEIARSEALAA